MPQHISQHTNTETPEQRLQNIHIKEEEEAISILGDYTLVRSLSNT